VFVTVENNTFFMKWPSLIAKNGKIPVIQRNFFSKIDSLFVPVAHENPQTFFKGGGTFSNRGGKKHSI
jgi:hypothetical protein